MQDSLYLYFDGLQHPLRLTGCEDLTEHFSLLFPEWHYQQGEQDDNPSISINFDGKTYQIAASWKDEVFNYTDKVDILCDLVAQLIVARSAADLETLYVHAASVLINGRVVVFPSQFRAGKSFLTACLLAEGHRYVGDDVFLLELDSCKGRSPGIAPRLRTPLPDTTDKKSRSFIESNISLAGKRYAYLDIEAELRVKPGELFDVGAFVLLEREEGTRALLEELPVATVFQQLVKQNFAREIDGARILSTLTQVVSNAQCIRLRYDRADEAVRLLTDHFANWPVQSNELQIEADVASTETQANEVIGNDSFVQGKGVQNIRIGEESFLTSPDGKAIYHLNVIGSGIWELLAEPTTKEEVVETLEMAFPDVERATIEEDVRKIIKRFRLKGLISH